MNIDLGFLGTVKLEALDEPVFSIDDGFLITHDGYTESGIRVHAVVDDRTWRIYPTCWNNAIIIQNWYWVK